MSREHAPEAYTEDSRETGPRVVTPRWQTAQHKAIAFAHTLRVANPLSQTELLIPAAQHPLVDGITPGMEFAHRLQAGVEAYHDITQATGQAAKFCVTGSRHFDKKSGKTDKVALYDAAGLWLLEHDIPADAIHGKDWMESLGSEVYNGADEIRVAAYGFEKNEEFNEATYFCSPGQVSRAQRYALAYHLPADIVVPETLSINDGEQFHGGLQHMVLQGITRTIDPYGAILARMTQDRLPADGNPGTSPGLLGNYSDLQWYRHNQTT